MAKNKDLDAMCTRCSEVGINCDECAYNLGVGYIEHRSKEIKRIRRENKAKENI